MYRCIGRMHGCVHVEKLSLSLSLSLSSSPSCSLLSGHLYCCTCVPVHRCTDVPVYLCTGEPVYQSTLVPRKGRVRKPLGPVRKPAERPVRNQGAGASQETGQSQSGNRLNPVRKPAEPSQETGTPQSGNRRQPVKKPAAASRETDGGQSGSDNVEEKNSGVRHLHHSSAIICFPGLEIEEYIFIHIYTNSHGSRNTLYCWG